MSVPISYDELMDVVKREYGDAGVCALETSGLTLADYEQGEEHCLFMLAPALEEELGGLD